VELQVLAAHAGDAEVDEPAQGAVDLGVTAGAGAESLMGVQQGLP
jgi:hypothetical protein